MQMCCAIPLAQKAQPAQLLGSGYKFAFVDAGTWASVSGQKLKHTPLYWKGLVLVTPAGKEIRNAAGHIRRTWGPELASAFFDQIGLDETLLDQTAVHDRRRLTPRQLYEKRCKSCLNCKKDDCKLCSSCLANASASEGGRLCCLQKVR